MTLQKSSPCKVNLLLNILRRRADGFHELETVMHPVRICDELEFRRAATGIQLSCSDPALPTDQRNLVHQAAGLFLQESGIADGVQIHLEKRLPLAAGLGGGSANAAITLQALNELFERPLSNPVLTELAARLGSDVPFFLQPQPALALGRGEQVESLHPFPILRGAAFLLIHPGFGISTAWAYQQLAKFPEALNGRPGRARELVGRLQSGTLKTAAADFYNSLEAPALPKYPLLELFQDFLREQGAPVTLMSGSGSTTFAIAESTGAAEGLAEKFKGKFGGTHWLRVVPVDERLPA